MARSVQDIVQAIVTNRGAFRTQAEATSKDSGLTPEGKTRTLIAAHKGAMDAHEALLTELKGSLESEAERAQTLAFGPLERTTEGQTALRGAIAYVEDQCKPGILSKGMDHLVEQAVLTGDKVLLRALSVVSLKRGDWRRLAALSRHDKQLADYLVAEKDRGNEHLSSIREKMARSMHLAAPERPRGLPNY